MDIQEFHASRRFADLRYGRVAYVERGKGPAALFLHGYPLNGFQWRGALDRLSAHRRCIAADFLGVGYTETPAGTDLTPETQVAMLAALLDALGEKSADIVANDSGGEAAQLFVARYPKRVRTLLLTNCDANTDCPPKIMGPIIEAAKAGVFTEQFVVRQLKDRAYARSPEGLLGAAYTYPDKVSDETLDVYLKPFVQSPLRRKQFEGYAIALEKNVLLPIEQDLRRFQAPVRIVWGTGDTIFQQDSPDWLHSVFPKSQGVRRLEGAKLFWPEEFPDVIAEEARKLWGVRA